MEQSDREWANPEAAQKEAEQKAKAKQEQALQAQTSATTQTQGQATNLTRPTGDADLEYERQQANKYVIISLCVRYAPELLVSLIGTTGYALSGASGGITESVTGSLSSLIALTVGPGYIASWVLAIIARTKYKSVKSPKILIIVYLVFLGLEILTIVLAFMTFVAIIESCRNIG